MIETTQKTVLYDEHVKLGGRIVDFEGWMMPVQYKSILEEHRAVRNRAGLFDVSHMGDFFVSGKNAEVWLSQVLTNDVAKLKVGSCHYTFLLNEEGGVIDDLILSRLSEEKFFLVVNAGKIEEDFEWMNSKVIEGVVLENLSDKYAATALQGPDSEKVLSKIADVELPKRNKIISWVKDGVEILVSRTGYTGEDGFEIFIPNEKAAALWNEILNQDVMPAGLGARDLLRLEACLPLNGHDLSPSITPIEAGFGRFVSFEKKEDFPGRAKLEKSEAKRSLEAFMMNESGALPRNHYAVYSNEEKIGEVTSGGISPVLQKGIGLALIDKKFAEAEAEIQIEIRGKKLPAKIKPKPLYKRK